MSFSGRVAYVAGGTGTVGSGFVRCLLNEGAKVAVSSRSQELLDNLSKLFDSDIQKNLILINEDVGKEEGAKRILQILREQHGGVHHVMSAIGTFWQGGTLSKQSIAEFDKQIDVQVKPVFICCKTFLPVLAEGKDTTYTFITGLSAEECLWPDISLLCVANKAIRGISLAAQAEYKESTNIAINELCIGMGILPQLNKDIDKSMETQMVGHDVIGDLLVCLNKSRTRGLVRITSKKDIETVKDKCQRK